MARIDTDQLLGLAYQRSPEGRVALALTLADMFSDGAGRLSEHERSLMFDILRQLVTEVEQRVRRALSLALADYPGAPHDLLVLLANDDAEVAFPILTRSKVLVDEDLIEVVRHRTQEHQLAIATRYAVSEVVSDAIAEMGRVDVVEALLRNENARISQTTLAFLAEESRRIDRYQEPLVHRRELGPELASRMFLWVSAAVRHHIVERFDFDPETLDALLQEVARRESEDAAAEGETSEAERLADAIVTEKGIQPDLLIQALVTGEINLFINMFGRAADLRTRLVSRFLFEEDGSGLAVACRGIGIDRETFRGIYALARASSRRPSGDIQKLIDRAVGYYDAVTEDEAKRVLARWRLDPDFSKAIRDVATGFPAHG
jgi:uncharacterized protein (DUF2336 family)